MGYFSDGLQKAIDLLLHMDDATFSAIEATLTSTSCALVIASVLGLPLAFCSATPTFRAKSSYASCPDTLLAFPTVLIGLVVYVLITYRGPFGQFGLLFTVPGMVIGQSILALPIVVSWTAQAVENLDRRCRETLLTLGASSTQLALHTIREIRYDLGMVCVTAFGRVVTEVGVAMMLGGNIRYSTRTMTTRHFAGNQQGRIRAGHSPRTRASVHRLFW